MIKLKSYQRDAIEKMKNGCILCGDVGSGKSLTALFYFYEKICNGKLKKNCFEKLSAGISLYIITTARKRDTLEWEKECSNFPFDNTLIVVDSWNNIHKYKNIKDSFFIFDEQRVIGSGLWVKYFLRIVENNRWILLSATPGDTWMDYIPVFIANGFYKNRTEFLKRHVVFSRFSKYPKVERYIEIGRLLRLKNELLIPMHFQRQTKSNIIKIIVSHDVIKENFIMKQKWNIYEEKPILDAGQLCFVMRKLVNSDECRIKELKNIFEKHSRIIVFYNFNYELDILINFCIENEITYSQWNGHKHELIPKDITWMYLVQYSAGSEGWNCIETDTIIFYSQTYSYRATLQAAGRINRMNTPFENLYYYHLISKSKIDQAIYRSLSMKKNFNEQKSFGF